MTREVWATVHWWLERLLEFGSFGVGFVLRLEVGWLLSLVRWKLGSPDVEPL